MLVPSAATLHVLLLVLSFSCFPALTLQTCMLAQAVPSSTTALAAQFGQWLSFAATKGALTLLLDGVEELDGSAAAMHARLHAMDTQALGMDVESEAAVFAGWGGLKGGISQKAASTSQLHT